MTKDLATAIHGAAVERRHYVTTAELVGAVADRLAKML